MFRQIALHAPGTANSKERRKRYIRKIEAVFQKKRDLTNAEKRGIIETGNKL